MRRRRSLLQTQTKPKRRPQDALVTSGRSASTSTPRERSRSIEQESVEIPGVSSTPNSTLPDSANRGVTRRLPKKNALEDFPRVSERMREEEEQRQARLRLGIPIRMELAQGAILPPE
eukprot:811166-Amphidinium_carterae.1